MEQKEIDRLLICRAAVDKQREFNKARVEAVTTCKSVTEAKTLIESKTGVATTISADSAVKTADAIKSTLEAERTKMTLAMYDVITGQGFESYGEFADWHDKLVLQAYTESYPMLGKCDLCGETEFKEQECIRLYKTGSCAYHWKDEGYIGEYQEGLKRLRKGITEIVNGITYPLSPCSKGHGYQHDLDNYKVPPFDLLWRA